MAEQLMRQVALKKRPVALISAIDTGLNITYILLPVINIITLHKQ